MDLTIEGQEELPEGVGAPSRGAGDRTRLTENQVEGVIGERSKRQISRASRRQSELPGERSKQGTSLP